MTIITMMITRLFKIILLILGILLAIVVTIGLVAEIFWFQEVDYLSIFLTRFYWQLGLGIVISLVSATFLLANLRFAQKYKWQSFPQREGTLTANLNPHKSLLPQSPPLSLPWLLLTVIGIEVLTVLILFYYVHNGLKIWTPNFNLPNVTPVIPFPLEIRWLKSVLASLSEARWQSAIILPMIVLLSLKCRESLRFMAIIISILFGLNFSGSWQQFIQFFYATNFDKNDPQFGNDISFYIFSLPIWQIFYFWLGGLLLYALISVTLTYLLSANSISEGKFPGFSRPQLRHLYALWGGSMGVLVLRHILNRYHLLYESDRGIIYGAGYTSVHIKQYIEIILGIIAGLSAIWLLMKAINGTSRQKSLVRPPRLRNQNIIYWLGYFWRIFPFYIGFLGLYCVVLIGGYLFTNLSQRIWVEPNELIREKPYIERSIAYTRAAFGLDKIESEIFDPQNTIDIEDLKQNNLTIDNIRIWDTKPILDTNRQLQQIRPYYRFPEAAIDRYLMRVESTSQTTTKVGTEKKQVIIAARELDYQAVPKAAKTWINEHLIYTHGYGFTLSPVNIVAQGGLPYYFVKDIGTNTDQGALQTANQFIEYSIPIGKPRIYYGQITNSYVMTSTLVKELDFPSGDENVYNIYDGTGGISLGSWWRRGLFAVYLKDWQMLFSRDFTPQTKLLMRRNLNQRLQAIAPFLQYDRSPYLVVADIHKTPTRKTKNTLYWIIDAYTISDRYPYSDPGKNNFNYIRNSVKVVIDAYNGDVSFYVADAQDPIIQTWSKAFPELFTPLAKMPDPLRSHIRYPLDLFTTQSERLLTYHMTDPQVFYNREDQWQMPTEIYGSEVKEVNPYYLIMKLPQAETEEFILLHPYTPITRPNLIAWLAARSDGEQYGKLLLYQFPKQKLVYGPNQIEALINQNPMISQQISLWNREGSKVIQGNLLVIPIEQSLLYMEPLYIEAEQNSLPTLARVILFYDNKIVMRETLKEALAEIFPS